MDHMVYLDEKEGDLRALRSGKKTMLAIGMSDRASCGAISENDMLLFVNEAANGEVAAKATASKVIIPPPLSQESCAELLAAHAMALALTANQARELVNRKYLVLVEIRGFEMVAADSGDRPPEAAQASVS